MRGGLEEPPYHINVVPKTSQELRMLSSVTINCQIIVRFPRRKRRSRVEGGTSWLESTWDQLIQQLFRRRKLLVVWRRVFEMCNFFRRLPRKCEMKVTNRKISEEQYQWKLFEEASWKEMKVQQKYFCGIKIYCYVIIHWRLLWFKRRFGEKIFIQDLEVKEKNQYTGYEGGPGCMRQGEGVPSQI